MAEYGVDLPLWGEPGGGDLPASALSLSPDLRQRLRAWNEEYERCALDESWDDQAAWRRRGLTLAYDVQHELGPEFEVSYGDERRPVRDRRGPG